MSGSFWRFGNGYGEMSAINTLLENGFVEHAHDTDKEKEKESEGDNNNNNIIKQRNDSVSSESTEDSDDSRYRTHDDTIEENEDSDSAPNLKILGRLLDEQDLLDELAASNLKLIQYLRHREVLDQLVKYITTDESEISDDGEQQDNDDDEEEEGSNKEQSEHSSSASDYEYMRNIDSQKETPREIHSRRAQVAAEILSADAWSLTDSFMDNSDLLSKLWSLLDKETSLSMVLSTYFMKINEHLLDSKTDEMLNFLLHQDNIVDRFLGHLDNPPLMDFLLKVISTDKPDCPTGIIELLKEQGLISKLITFLDPQVNPSIQSAAGDFIKAFVTISANSNTDNSTIGPNELTRELVSEPIMTQLCGLMLNGGTSLANGVGIIIEIIRKNNSDYDYVPVLFITIESHPPTSRDPIYLGHLIKVFAKNIPKFTAMLENTLLPDLNTPFGKIEPLGFERFKICELIAELLHCSNMQLLNDESGEDIVRERDLERERVIALEKQQQDEDEQEFRDDDDDDDEGNRNTNNDDEDHDEQFLDVSRDIERLSIASDDTFEPEAKNESLAFAEEEEDKEKTPVESQTEDADEEGDDNDDDDDDDDDDDLGKKKTILESEPDSDVDATLGTFYDEAEAQLRKDPVIGDKLKIALADNGVILFILKMFFRFPWNNFLHNVVFDIVQQILNASMEIGYNKYLAIGLFKPGDITNLIIEGQEKCEEYERNHGLRLGYMGHLTLIAEEVVKFTALYPPNTIHQIILDTVSTQEWTVYVTETLVETREKYNTLLCGEVENEVQEGIPAGEGQEVEEEKRVNQEMKLDPNVDHDITGSGFEEINKDQIDDETRNVNVNNDNEDENNEEGEEGDQFSRYMSQQMTNDLPDKFESSDEDDEEEDDHHHHHHQSNNNNNPHGGTPTTATTTATALGVGYGDHRNSGHEYFSIDDEDDYVDPNDDGQSYTRKDHPLYHGMLSPTSQRHPFDDEDEVDVDDDSSSDDDEDDIDDDDEEGEGFDDKDDGAGLSRSKSKGELTWDEDEQNRLINMASYIKNHNMSS